MEHEILLGGAFLAAFLLAGLLRLAGGPGRGHRLTGAAIGLAVAGAAQWQGGWPFVPALIAAGALVGAALDLGDVPGGWALPVLVVASALALWRLLGREPAPLFLPLWIAILVRLEWDFRDDRIPMVMLAACAAGLGAVGLIVGQARLAGVAFALAGASLGVLLWNLPFPRFPFGHGAVLGGGGTLAILATTLLRLPHPQILPLMILGLVFFADVRPAFGSPLLRQALGPLLLALSCAAPVAAAALLAYAETAIASR